MKHVDPLQRQKRKKKQAEEREREGGGKMGENKIKLESEEERRAKLTRWVPYDGYIRHQNDHLSGRMTDISVMGEWQVVGVGGLGHSGMFWARLSGDDFRSKLEIISFLSRVMFISKSFLFPALLQNLVPNVRALGLLVSTMSWSSFWKLRSVTGHFLTNSDYDHEFFLKISFLFSKQSRFYLPDSYGDPQAEQSSLVVVRRKLEWKRVLRALARSSAEEPSIVVAFSTSRLRWSMVQKRQNPDEVSQWLPLIVYKNQRGNHRVLRSLFPRPRCFYRFAIRFFLYSAVQQHVGQAADRGQRRKAVIRDTSGVDHRAVTILIAPIWFTGRRHCTVFRHVMQLSLLVLR